MTQPSSITFSRTASTAVQGERMHTSAPSALSAESQLFANIMAQGAMSGSLTSGSAKDESAADTYLIDAMSEQWALRLNAGTQWPMQFVFYLAGRGRLQVSAAYEQNAWSLSVQAEQPGTRQWLNAVRHRCEQRLAQRLGQPVNVQVIQERWG